MARQNTSSAVMAQRKEAPDSLDYFPTPAWATRALCVHVLPELEAYNPTHEVWEPACGEGHMARPLSEYFAQVWASDIHAYDFENDGRTALVHDFLTDGLLEDKDIFGHVEWVITNPPFNKAPEFVDRALEVATVGCAMLVRTAFAEGVDRFLNLFQPTPPVAIAQFTQRVPMVKGRVDAKASSATSYAWFVWHKRHRCHTRLLWIPPCRKALERPGDYESSAGCSPVALEGLS